MKIIYHERYCDVYTQDPAAEAGRIESIRDNLKGRFDFVEPKKAYEENIALVHTPKHIDFVKGHKSIYPIALLAVGGAIKASEFALTGEPTFSLIRPPGHHASQDSCWGFCYFNNVAISVQRLLKLERIKNTLIIDFDLHFGDGTDNIFRKVPSVSYFHLPYNNSIEALDEYLRSQKDYDMIAVSAGFDRHYEDWGSMLSTQDYKTIGEILKEHAERKCSLRVFAVLEGGYNHNVLGLNVRAFLEGLE